MTRLVFGLAGASLGAAVGAVLLLLLEQRSAPPIVIEGPLADAPIVVVVEGAVATPGLYALGGGARLFDALAAAGGPARDADLSKLNQATRLRDEERVIVPYRGVAAGIQREDARSTVAGAAEDDGPSADRAPPPETDTVSEPRLSDLSESSLVNINTATAEQLDDLPEIGPARAAAIIRYRETHGDFGSVDELADVENLPAGVVDRLRDQVTVGP